MDSHHYLGPVADPASEAGLRAGSPVSQMRCAVRKRFAAGVLVFVLAAPAMVGLVIWEFGPRYRAEATVQVNPIRPRILYRTDDNMTGRSYAEFFATQLAIVRSSEVLTRCLNDPAVSGAPFLAGMDDPVQRLRDVLEVERLGSTQLFSVSISWDSPQGVAVVVNGAVRAYLGYLDEADTSSQNRKLQLLNQERTKLKQDVEMKVTALAKQRASFAGDPNAARGVVLRDPVSITYEAIVDIQTRRATLNARLSSRRALLEKKDLRVPARQLEEALDRDPDVQRLTALTDQFRRELLASEAEAASPAVNMVQTRINMDSRIMALNQEIARRELQLAWLSRPPADGPATESKDAKADVPAGLILEALADHPEAQRLAALSAQLRQELASVEASSSVPLAAAVRERLNAEPQIAALRQEEARREIELAVRSETLSKAHPSLQHSKATRDGVEERLRKAEEESKGKVVEELKAEMKQDSEQRAKEIRTQLKTLDEQIRPYRDKALANTKSILTALRKRLDELEPELRLKVTEEMKQNARRRATELRAQLRSAEEQIERLRDQARGRASDRLKESARAEVQREIDEVQEQVVALDRSEADLRTMLKSQAAQRTDTERRAAEVRQMEEDLARSQQSLQGVEQRLHELEVEASAPGYISIASFAKDPVSPEPYIGRRVKYSIVGVMGAAGLALLAMILLDRRDDRVWSADDLHFQTDAELLGCVTHWDSEPGGALGEPALLCHPGAQSLAAEEIRNLMAGILYPADGKPARTLLITGAAPGDGRTTIAVNLAAAVAGLGKNVLLVDANFRKPDVAGVFAFGNVPGLGDVLAYGADPAKVIRSTQLPCLSVLTAGTTPSDSVGLLGSGSMSSLLDRLRSEYDYVFIDAPPVVLADARVMAPMVDGVVCSFRALASRRAAVRECLTTLRRLGARTVGIALVGVNPKHNGHRAAVQMLTTYTQLDHTPEPTKGA